MRRIARGTAAEASRPGSGPRQHVKPWRARLPTCPTRLRGKTKDLSEIPTSDASATQRASSLSATASEQPGSPKMAFAGNAVVKAIRRWRDARTREQNLPRQAAERNARAPRKQFHARGWLSRGGRGVLRQCGRRDEAKHEADWGTHGTTLSEWKGAASYSRRLANTTLGMPLGARE